MLIRQSKNTFIRVTERYGYITNQMTRHDRTYDENGADWLREITRETQNIDDIIDRLQKNYCDVDTETLKSDFIEFAESLARDYCARCLVRNYNESGGDMFAVNHHFCDVAFLNKKIVEEYKEKGLL